MLGLCLLPKDCELMLDVVSHTNSAPKAQKTVSSIRSMHETVFFVFVENIWVIKAFSHGCL